MTTPKICVVGACNVDLTSYAKSMPQWGETIRGDEFELSYGGKGANQAVMAAKLGASVNMVSKVGTDIFGEGIIDNMKGYGIDVSHIHKTDETRTGTAQIMVDQEGRNAIIVVTGASDRMTLADVQAVRAAIGEADVLLVQWEMPIEISLEAIKIAKGSNTKVVFNPAPMGENIPDGMFPLCDIVCLNETEITALTGMSVKDEVELETATQALINKGAESVVVTLGKKGAFYNSPEESFIIEPQTVEAKDSTGAGDCFCGSLAYFIALGDSKRSALQKANRIAAISVQKKGTQTSYPDREALKNIIRDEKYYYR